MLNLGLLAWPRKNIPHSSHGFDVLIVLGVAQFLSHLADMHIDAAIERRELAAQHRIDQPFARHDATGFTEQHFQKIELDRRLIYRAAIQTDRARSWI